ncbi:MAG TPA: AAA family ATPase [Gaiellaceae bacterium]|nr:AAA family ATPase [Gaiellaceae bacterium]
MTAAPVVGTLSSEESRDLNNQWRALRRAATAVALISSPALFVWLCKMQELALGWAIIATILCVAAFRGLLDVIFHRFIEWPSLFGVDNAKLREEDVVARRRVWFWRWWAKLAYFFLLIIFAIYVVRVLKYGLDGASLVGTASDTWDWLTGKAHVNGQTLGLLFTFVLFFIFNFGILMGPMLFMGISQIRGFEPGDADWGVKLHDVRGQAEAKEEVRRVVSLWQSGEAFEKAGGRRERGLLFLGAPGTGKTMLAKAIATGFNSPIVTIPGSGFAQTFMGMDVVIVRYMARKAKKLARKWGGQCIVFIDEIDAVGMRRQSLGGGAVGAMTPRPQSFHDLCFFGPNGALNASEDLVLESRAWRERMFAARAPQVDRATPVLGRIVNQVFPGMFGGGQGQLALNQLLIVMDGIDNPPFMKRALTNRLNTVLDALYIIPRRLGRLSFRLPHARPAGNQIYFIGATNVPMEMLDPALTRPGRMGRHVWFRTPTKGDRLDIFDLYLQKVAHDEDLDTEKRRDELARVTNGYSPAMIEQVCSMALTIAHHDRRPAFSWGDIVEAMTTVESGTAIGTEYVPEETRAVAIHEAGHAAAAHVYMKGAESTRLSIRQRGAALGHHQAREKEERFSSWRSEELAQLIWALGAMAAERVFYGENSTGVGGDVQSATARAAWMVGACGMAPEAPEVNGRSNGKLVKRAKAADEKVDDVMKRFEQIGLQIMNRTGNGGALGSDPLAGVLGDHDKRALAAQLLGQAYVTAYALIAYNKKAVEQIAEALIEKKELFGDELVEILESAKLKVPKVDLTQAKAWPAV